MKKKVNLVNVYSYCIGWYRYFLYYSKQTIKIDLSGLIRSHIKEQIDMRIKSMDTECYENGSCKLCGCSTTALQMANKACDKPCYPRLIGKTSWKRFRQNYMQGIDGEVWIINKNRKFEKYLDWYERVFK